MVKIQDAHVRHDFNKNQCSVTITGRLVRVRTSEKPNFDDTLKYISAIQNTLFLVQNDSCLYNASGTYVLFSCSPRC